MTSRSITTFFVAFSITCLVLWRLPIEPLFAPGNPGGGSPIAMDREESRQRPTGIDDFGAIYARPLFDSSRSPPVTENTSPPVEPMPQRRLVEPILEGTVRRHDGSIVAYLRFEGEQQTRRLVEGDVYNDWQVKSVAVGVAVVAGDDRNVELKVNDSERRQ